MKQYLTFAILLELTKHEKIPANHIAQKFEISRRTVYRYLNELESAGIPTFTTLGKNGGIGIEKNFALDSLLLTQEEKQALRQSLQFIDSPIKNTIIEKLNL